MIVLGRIVAPYGIKGWVKIHPFGDDPASWRKMSRWWLSRDDNAPDEAWRAVELKNCRVHGRGVVAELEGVDTREAAEALDGHFIAAPRESLPAPATDEYYWADLIGLQVENEAGTPLGEVVRLISTGAHDVLALRDGEQERLIPFVAAYVLDVDLPAKRIKVAWEADW